MSIFESVVSTLCIIISMLVAAQQPIELEKVEKDNIEVVEELTIPEGFTEEDVRMIATMVCGECGAFTDENATVTVKFEDGTIKDMPVEFLHEINTLVILNHLKDERLPDTVYDDMCYPRYSEEYRTEYKTNEYINEYGDNWYVLYENVLKAMNGKQIEELQDFPADVIYESNYYNLGTGHFAEVSVRTEYFSSTAYYAHG